MDSGPSGVGKTLTAEAAAEKKKRPLYNVRKRSTSCLLCLRCEQWCAGDLGTDPQRLEISLLEITSLAHKWEAVILIDEADVYLAERSQNDIHRNSLVSVFLRQLEYFEGIMFLTTNRVQTFDTALQSRVHIAIKFGDLGKDAMKEIWKIHLKRVNMDVNTSGNDIEGLTREKLNGRQVRIKIFGDFRRMTANQPRF